MDLKWLEDFISLSQTRNFSRTAEERNITQSALSRRIQSLENWAGTRLIDRKSHPITLTPSGDCILKHAEEIVRRTHLAKAEVHARTRLKGEPIAFAMQYTIARSIFPKWLQAIEPLLEPFNVRIKADNLTSCLRDLIEGRVDFMFCYDSPHYKTIDIPKNLSFIRVSDSKSIPVCIPTDDGKPKYSLPGSVDRPLPFLSFGPEAPLGWQFEVLLAARGLTPYLETKYEASISECLREKVLEGEGVAWLPYPVVEDDIRLGRMVLAGDDTWVIEAEVLMYRTRGVGSAKVESLWQVASKLPKL
ncbi:LysR substrate-binding domain-containing protein [Pontibacterium granulatum]|uniref:LysR family transcriptional regulator n=1 Tax=Pontibacterium granulatum TaxID=2036029 RepID=UPI002499C9BD|nr:LysR family transcriptional regulator [Pontibacterium granulatum]MDI3324375.1 LysR substrate-binding domain-containing protein [Pontibacterium granulatum]